MSLEFFCNDCYLHFTEEEMGEEDTCPSCGGNSLQQRELDEALIDLAATHFKVPERISVYPVELNKELWK
jgi:hypothetical protein